MKYKCKICKCEIFDKKDAKKHKDGYAHIYCFRVKSTIVLNPLNVEEFIGPSPSGSHKNIINDNIIGEIK